MATAGTLKHVNSTTPCDMYIPHPVALFGVLFWVVQLLPALTKVRLSCDCAILIPKKASWVVQTALLLTFPSFPSITKDATLNASIYVDIWPATFLALLMAVPLRQHLNAKMEGLATA